MMILREYLYETVVTSFLLSAYLYFRFKVAGIELKKIKNLKKRSIKDPIETESPIEDFAGELKEAGKSGIESRFSFIQKLLPAFIFMLWMLLLSVPHLGKVPSVYVSIIAAIVSVLTGFAVRPFLENLFSGVVISFFRNIRLGDTVIIDGHYGVIEDIGFTNTILKTWDWNRIIIPNSRMLQKEIQNLTVNDQYLWSHVEFFVSPKADISQVEAFAVQAAKGSSAFNPEFEEPSFWVMGLEKDAIKCWVAAWANNPADAWQLKSDIRIGLIKSLSQNHIDSHHVYFSHHSENPIQQF